MDERNTQGDGSALAETLTRLRAEQRLSQADLARLSTVSRETLSLIERAGGRARKRPTPHPETLRLLAVGLATDGKGVLHEDLRDRYYAELMDAAGYLPAEAGIAAAARSQGLWRSDDEVNRWLADQVDTPDLVVMYARAIPNRKYLSPEDQAAMDNLLRIFSEKAENNKRMGRQGASQ